MKVLDLFCGRGGWSKPFVEAGDEVVGIDIVDVGYPAKLILKDVREVNGKDFVGFDCIIGSPPCAEFSEAKGNKGDIQNGLSLVREFLRIVEEAQPKFWIMENVTGLAKYLDFKPVWKFYIGRKGRRFLWGNILISLSPEFRFPQRIMHSGRVSTQRYWIRKGVKILNSRSYAEIPFPIAKFIHDCVKNALKEQIQV